jgi:probable F420-dependent oxidoreductase
VLGIEGVTLAIDVLSRYVRALMLAASVVLSTVGSLWNGQPAWSIEGRSPKHAVPVSTSTGAYQLLWLARSVGLDCVLKDWSLMRLGAILPQTEIGSDPAVIRTYAQAVEDLGFSHIVAYDHVVGADPAVYAGWSGPYDVDTQFHEPMVLFGFLAACTRRVELVTGVVILPQRQTALLAKQAAEVDLLSAGRMRLGVGVGWNPVEYESLGQDFATRGRRMEEQVALLRALWTERSVMFDGSFDHVHGAGLSPLPVQRPIPVWLGGSSRPAYRRMGRIADGWFPLVPLGPQLDDAIATVHTAAIEAGRDPALIGMEGRINWDGDLERATEQAGRWAALGATHLSVNTMNAGLLTLDDHLAVLAALTAVFSPDSTPQHPPA